MHLLEVTVISAQDLHRRRWRLGRRVRAYAVAWADAGQKLRTGVDHAGGAVPTWNDRFLFRVDGAFLRSDTASLTVEVRGTGGLGTDPVLGVTRIVVSTFVRPDGGGRGGTQVAALQLRRPRSLRPQGTVNVAVTLLDAAREPPLYSVPGSLTPSPLSVLRRRCAGATRPVRSGAAGGGRAGRPPASGAAVTGTSNNERMEQRSRMHGYGEGRNSRGLA